MRMRRPIRAPCTPTPRLLRLLLHLLQTLFDHAVVRRLRESRAIPFDGFLTVALPAVLLADERVDLRGFRIELAVHLEDGDCRVTLAGLAEPPGQLVELPFP